MHTHHMRLRVSSLVAVSVLVTGLLVAASSTAQTDDQRVAPSYLFALEGRDVELAPIGRSKSRFEFSMAIRGSDHLVAWFTDRPVRDAGHTSVKNFVRLWDAVGPNSFKADPPNVALAFGLRTVVAIMTDPRIIVTKDRGEVLSATFTLIKGEDLAQIASGSGAIVGHAKRAGDNALTGRLRIPRAGLFIDAYQPSSTPAPSPAPSSAAPAPATPSAAPAPATSSAAPAPATSSAAPAPAPATSSAAPAPAPAPPPPFPIPPSPPPWPYTGCMDWTCGI